jgi:Protein of unknown function (DUF2914)
MRQGCFIVLLMAVVVSSGLFAQSQANIKAENIAICTSVENRQPKGTDSVFAADAGQLYCYTKLVSETDMSKVSHVWFYQDKQMSKIDLTMKAKTWRTWSSKTILPDWKGDWRVEVQDAEGTVISRISFKIK